MISNFPKALQLGIALGLAVLASITTSVDKSHTASSPGSKAGYDGIAAGYWFILGLVILFAILVLIFYKSDRPANLAIDEEQSFGDHELKVRRESICLDVRPGTTRTSIVLLPSRSSHERRELESAFTEGYTKTKPQAEMEDEEEDEEKEGTTDGRRRNVRTSIITLPTSDAHGLHGYQSDEESDHEKEAMRLTPLDWEPRRPERARSRNSTVRFSLQLQDDNRRGLDASNASLETRQSGQFMRANSVNRRGQGRFFMSKGETRPRPESR